MRKRRAQGQQAAASGIFSTEPYPATTTKWKFENTGGNAFSISSRFFTSFPA